MKHRFYGFLVLALSIIFEWLYLQSLFNGAENRAKEIIIHKSFIAIPIIVASLGILCMMLGKRTEKILKMDDNNLSFSNIVIIIIPIVFSVVAYEYIISILNRLGYII